MAKWQEVSVTIHREAEEPAVAILMETGASGVAIEDTALYLMAKEHNWGDIVDDIEHSDMITIRGYFPVEASSDLMSMQQKLFALSDLNLSIGELRLTEKVVDDNEWAESWKRYYHTERYGRIVVKPSWEEYTAKPDELVICLDPGMAFGTGNHPSTAMCLKLLQGVFLEGKVVWDIGTGSGILAIGAKKLGAKEVFAVDIDPVAVKIAQDNICANGVSIAVKQGSVSSLFGQADVIVANIVADVIIDMMPQVQKALAKEGTFIASGIIASRAEAVAEQAKAYGFRVLEKAVNKEWVAYVFKGR